MEQNSMQAMQARIKRLERRLYIFYMTGLSAIVLAIFVYAVSPAGSAQSDDSAKVIRARGLVIVDEQGRERILLGAPIPAAANRVRTDLMRVKEIWGKRFPPEYMQYYQGYRHNTNGLLILDEKGFDRIAIGDPVPDPNTGKRIGPSTGLAINDEQGFERSGYGLLKVKDNYRVVLGLDSADGSEGLSLLLFDNGPTGLRMLDKDRSLYLGTTPENFMPGITEPFQGLLLQQGKEVKYQINIARPKVEKRP